MYSAYVAIVGCLLVVGLLAMSSCVAAVRSVEHNAPTDDGFPSRYPDRAELLTMLHYRNLERSQARRPRSRKAIELSRYYWYNFAVDSALNVLRAAAVRPNATESVHAELLGRLNEVGSYAEAQTQLDLALRKTRHPGRYRRQTTLLALQLGRPVDYASPTSGLTLAEVLHVRAVESALRGDLVTTLIAAESATYVNLCDASASPWPSALLHDTYQKLLSLSVAGEPWPRHDYPPESFEATYAACLEAAFAEVVATSTIAGPYYELAYEAVTRGHRCVLADRGHTGKPILMVAALAKLHEANAYRPYFYWALVDGANLRGGDARDPAFDWFVTYATKNDGDRARCRALFERSLICDVIAGLRQG